MGTEAATPEQVRHRANMLGSQLLLRRLRRLHYGHAPDDWKRKFVPSPHLDHLAAYVQERESMELSTRDQITAAINGYERAEAQVQRVPLRVIVAVVARYYGLELTEILGRNKHRKVLMGRNIVFYLAASLGGYTFVEIGRRIGGRDHSTVSFCHASIVKKMKLDTTLKIQVETIKAQVMEYLNSIDDAEAA